MTRETLTVEEAAKVLGVGRNTAYEAVRRGEIPSIRVGRRLVVPKAALERMLECGGWEQFGGDRDVGSQFHPACRETADGQRGRRGNGRSDRSSGTPTAS